MLNEIEKEAEAVFAAGNQLDRGWSYMAFEAKFIQLLTLLKRTTIPPQERAQLVEILKGLSNCRELLVEDIWRSIDVVLIPHLECAE